MLVLLLYQTGVAALYSLAEVVHGPVLIPKEPLLYQLVCSHGVVSAPGILVEA
jgi:hypothetical protein